ncbi:MAG: hypothetical protein JXA14_08900 [Anaerolineae bacterium]|nr:hypothetical protein [Anaerolineae bacterium]
MIYNRAGCQAIKLGIAEAGGTPLEVGSLLKRYRRLVGLATEGARLA